MDHPEQSKQTQFVTSGSAIEDRTTRDLRILYAVAQALNSAPDVRQALQQTLVLVTNLLGLQTGWVWLLDAETNRFYSAAALNLPPYLQRPIRMSGKRCWCIRMFQRGEPALKNIDVLECSRLRPAVRKQADELTRGLRYHASVPLYFQDRPLGIMNLTSPTWRELTAHELQLLSTIANQVGIAIERARLAEESRRLARAEERTRMAREIHDTLAQGLTGIVLQLEGALRQLGHQPELAQERLERALAMSRQSLEEARRSVVDLRSTSLARPLPEALNTLARSITSDTGVRVQVRTSGESLLPVSVESELFTIAQEALTNVYRHARASEALVSLQFNQGSAVLTVRDNGCGFNPDDIGDGHFGIVGMRERADHIGGRLYLESEPGHGTSVRVEAPLGLEDGP
jgi:two-component system, NarL family, sensor kinase